MLSSYVFTESEFVVLYAAFPNLYICIGICLCMYVCMSSCVCYFVVLIIYRLENQNRPYISCMLEVVLIAF